MVHKNVTNGVFERAAFITLLCAHSPDLTQRFSKQPLVNREEGEVKDGSMVCLFAMFRCCLLESWSLLALVSTQ